MGVLGDRQFWPCWTVSNSRSI